MSDKKNVLVLCTGNSCRSQLLHGYLEQLLGEQANMYSAGVEVHGLNPRAMQTMATDGVDISHYTSNHVNEYAQMAFDFVLTVCDHANEGCTAFSSSAKKLHHNFPDPAKTTASEAEIMAQFQAVREQIKNSAQEFAQAEFASVLAQ